MALREELKSQGDFLFRYRSHLPFLLLVVGVGLKIYNAINQSEAELFWTYQWLLDSAFFVGLLGLVIRIITVGYTPKNTSGRNTAEGQVADTLNTAGMYSMLRNPLYLGNYLMWLGLAMYTGSFWFVITFTLVFWIYYERIVFAEESFLREKFGDVYLNWAAKVPPFIPKNLNWQTPSYSFSWKKVLKKEKNGLFALFAVFYLLDVIAEYAVNHTYTFEFNWLSIGTIASGVVYFILKFLKSKTKVLDEEGR